MTEEEFFAPHVPEYTPFTRYLQRKPLKFYGHHFHSEHMIAINVDEDYVDLTQPSAACPPSVTLKTEEDDDGAATARNVARWSTWANFCAPPSDEHAVENQDLTSVPSVFPTAEQRSAPAVSSVSSDQPPVPRAVSRLPIKQEKCGFCGVAIPKNPNCVELNKVVCDACGLAYHFHCQDLRRPPKYGSFLCKACRVP
jgi:hypothetical protein